MNYKGRSGIQHRISNDFSPNPRDARATDTGFRMKSPVTQSPPTLELQVGSVPHLITSCFPRPSARRMSTELQRGSASIGTPPHRISNEIGSTGRGGGRFPGRSLRATLNGFPRYNTLHGRFLTFRFDWNPAPYSRYYITRVLGKKKKKKGHIQTTQQPNTVHVEYRLLEFKYTASLPGRNRPNYSLERVDTNQLAEEIRHCRESAVQALLLAPSPATTR